MSQGLQLGLVPDSGAIEKKDMVPALEGSVEKLTSSFSTV